MSEIADSEGTQTRRDADGWVPVVPGPFAKVCDEMHTRNTSGLHIQGFCRVCAEIYEALNISPDAPMAQQLADALRQLIDGVDRAQPAISTAAVMAYNHGMRFDNDANFVAELATARDIVALFDASVSAEPEKETR